MAVSYKEGQYLLVLCISRQRKNAEYRSDTRHKIIDPKCVTAV